MTTTDSVSSSWTLSPSLSRASSCDLSILCSVSRDNKMKQTKTSGSLLLKLPNLSVPSILRTPTKNLSRLREHPPHTPSFSRRRVSCCRNSSPITSGRATPSSNRRTPRCDRAPRTPCRQFPSPLFCSSPTLAVPLFLGTPASTPHCPSPIRHKPLNKTANSCLLEEKEDRCGGEIECIVRIAGRRLFESGCSLSPSPWSPDTEKNRSKARDKIGLLTFILDTECSKQSEDFTPSSYSDDYSGYTSPPTCSRVIHATQDSMRMRCPQEEDELAPEGSLINSCNSLLLKYPHLFSSINTSGDKRKTQDTPMGAKTRQDNNQISCSAQKRKRDGTQLPDLDLQGAKRVRGGEEKVRKQKLKSLLSTLIVAAKKRKQRTRLVTPYRSSAHLRTKV
ncbi:hypothetical protein ACHWQZ_G003187 [Mnemiopsis leidyi]